MNRVAYERQECNNPVITFTKGGCAGEGFSITSYSIKPEVTSSDLNRVIQEI